MNGSMNNYHFCSTVAVTLRAVGLWPLAYRMSVTLPDDRNAGIASELSAFQQRILTILSDEARYGLAIKDELEEFYGEDVNHGCLYPNLDELVEMGLVAKSARDRRTNEYALTEAGQDALTNQLSWVFSRFVTTDARAATLKDCIPAAQQ